MWIFQIFSRVFESSQHNLFKTYTGIAVRGYAAEQTTSQIGSGFYRFKNECKITIQGIKETSMPFKYLLSQQPTLKN